MTPLPYPLTEAELTPTLAAAMPDEMKGAFIRLFNALGAEGVKPDTATYKVLDLLCWDLGWCRQVDGSYERDPYFADVGKAGRVLSAANEAKARAALESLTALLTSAAPKPKPDDEELDDDTDEEEPAEKVAKGRVIKVEARRMAYGWASVTTAKGRPVVDSDGDVIDVNNLRDVMHDYMKGDREVWVGHVPPKVGHTVELLVIDDDVAKALTADLKAGVRGAFYARKYDTTPEGEAAYQAVLGGDNGMASIGGSGFRQSAK